MSASQWFARITSTSKPPRYFVAGQILSGSLGAHLAAVLVPIESGGVDGKLFRRRNKQAEPLVLALTEPVADVDSAESAYQDYIGEKITLSIRVKNIIRAFAGSTVVEAQVQNRTGVLTGYGVGGEPGVVQSQWVIERPVIGTRS